MNITNPLAFVCWFVAWTALIYVMGWMHGQLSQPKTGVHSPEGEKR